MVKILQIISICLITISSGISQHHNSDQKNDATKNEHTMRKMISGFFQDLSMRRDGSGTSWHPDSSPMSGVHKTFGSWDIMLHGAAFIRLTSQDIFDKGTRGQSEFSLPNWFMLMAQKPLGKRSQLLFRTMVTLEPATEGGKGYPYLFQTGETYNDELLIDRQHPHDMIAEMAVAFSRTFRDSIGVLLYFGYPGEPALGPPTFMHRPSARHNPVPPLAHHWQDASHITYGVATLGLRHQNLKLDISVFTGREPDQNRYTPDKPRFDSWSARLSANATEHLALQFSRAFLNSPEEFFPDSDLWRSTASVLFNQSFGDNAHLAAAAIWGMNQPANDNQQVTSILATLRKSGQNRTVIGAPRIEHVPPQTRLHSVLLESDLMIGRQAYYARFEWVEKSTLDLGLNELGDLEVNIKAVTFGISREIASFGDIHIQLGAQASIYGVPKQLQPVYGEAPISAEVYMRLSPPAIK